jgi:hypothetical protein
MYPYAYRKPCLAALSSIILSNGLISSGETRCERLTLGSSSTDSKESQLGVKEHVSPPSQATESLERL